MGKTKKFSKILNTQSAITTLSQFVSPFVIPAFFQPTPLIPAISRFSVPRQSPSDGQENLIDIVGVLSRGLHEQEAVFLSVSVGLLVLDRPPGPEVGFVARQGDHNVRSGLSLQLPHPGFGAGEGVGVGDVVDDDGGLRAAVVHGG